MQFPQQFAHFSGKLGDIPPRRLPMPRLILFNKPFQVLCQFRDKDGRPTLADFITLPGIYPAGRLDHDSEGLLLLTDHGPLQARIADPRWKQPKTYWAQVEGEVTEEALQKLREGVVLNDGPTLPAEARRIEAPVLWERDPPIRQRANIPTSWVALTLREGRNRQVRRMTAAVGFPTLRLVRAAIGPWALEGLAPGEYREIRLGRQEMQDMFGLGPEAPAKAGKENKTGEGRTGRERPLRASSDPRPLRRSSSPRPSAPPRSPTPSSRKGRGS